MTADIGPVVKAVEQASGCESMPEMHIGFRPREDHE